VNKGKERKGRSLEKPRPLPRFSHIMLLSRLLLLLL